VCLFFSWVIQCWWFNEAKQLYNTKPSLTTFQGILAFIASILFCISTAAIDTGKMNMHLHQFCATGFFVVTYLNIVINTAKLAILRCTSPKSVTFISLVSKIVITLISTFVIIFDITHSSSWIIFGNNGLTSDIGNICEYAITFLFMAYFLLM